MNLPLQPLMGASPALCKSMSSTSRPCSDWTAVPPPSGSCSQKKKGQVACESIQSYRNRIRMSDTITCSPSGARLVSSCVGASCCRHHSR